MRIVVGVLPEFLQPAEGKGQLQLAALIHGGGDRFLNGKSNRHGNLLMCMRLLAGRFPATVYGNHSPRIGVFTNAFIWPYNAHSAEVDGQTSRKSCCRKLAGSE